MPEKSQLDHQKRFYKHFVRNALVGLLIMLISLGIGMAGYHYFEELSIVDSYLNASMILSGMGPAAELKTDEGKIFAGTYALFSGVIFLVVIAIIFAPVVRRFLHKFHMEENL